jgi:hypothetical protein
MEVEQSHIGDRQNLPAPRLLHRVGRRHNCRPFCMHLDQFKRTAKMTTWLTSVVANGALSKWFRRSPKSLTTIPLRMLVSLEGGTSTSNPEGRRITPARLRPGTSVQLRAVSQFGSFVLLQLALLLSAPSLRAAPSDQPVDTSSLPDSPEPHSRTSSPALQPDPGREDALAGDPSIVGAASVPCTTCRLNWYQRFTKRPAAETPHP